MSKTLDLFVVYERPSDFPNEFVCRVHRIHGNGVSVAVPSLFAQAPNLDDLRRLLPKGLVCVPADVKDDPVIVETWL